MADGQTREKGKRWMNSSKSSARECRMSKRKKKDEKK
jgi:hypothetical protein